MLPFIAYMDPMVMVVAKIIERKLRSTFKYGKIPYRLVPYFLVPQNTGKNSTYLLLIFGCSIILRGLWLCSITAFSPIFLTLTNSVL